MARRTKAPRDTPVATPTAVARGGLSKPVAGLVAGGAVIAAAVAGTRFGPTPNRPATLTWYARLRKPSFTPPGPAFGIAWSVLDGLLWYSGTRLMSRPAGARRNVAIGLWGTTILGVGGFSWVLFGRRRLDEALGVTIGMLGTSTALVTVAAPVDRKAALANVPLALWVAFASVLQEEVWRRNR